MKRSNLQLVVLLGLVLVIVFLSSCGGNTDTAADAAPAGDGDFQPPARENGGPNAQGFPMGGAAFGGATQLALGTLYLQSTDVPITAEQAATLLPLWQEYQSQQDRDQQPALHHPGTAVLSAVHRQHHGQ